MTLVATWLNLETATNPSIWSISDSKVTDVSDNTTLTEQAAKLLEVPLVCRVMNEAFPTPYFQSSIGFAFAGNTLLATNVHATLCVMLGNLGSSQYNLPNHLAILEKARVLVQEYSELNPPRTAQLCLYGICPQMRTPFIGVISGAVVEDRYHYQVAIHDCTQADLTLVMIGDETAISDMNKIIVERISRHVSELGSDYWRIPIFSLHDLLLKRTNLAIGGELQMTICNQHYFRHFWVPSDSPDGKEIRTLRGIDLDKVGVTIGGCRINIPGMDYMIDVKYK